MHVSKGAAFLILCCWLISLHSVLTQSVFSAGQEETFKSSYLWRINTVDMSPASINKSVVLYVNSSEQSLTKCWHQATETPGKSMFFYRNDQAEKLECGPTECVRPAPSHCLNVGDMTVMHSGPPVRCCNDSDRERKSCSSYSVG